jgi:hypothetical protein
MSLKRGFALLAFASVALVVACSDESRGGYGLRSRGSRDAMCGAQSSCLTCTPVVGCGWCQLPDGTGRCVDDPNDCQRATTFSWTWEPSGCREAADASVSTSGGSSSSGGSSGRLPQGDAGEDAPDDAPAASDAKAD